MVDGESELAHNYVCTHQVLVWFGRQVAVPKGDGELHQLCDR
jgi:hypothetical protein